MLENFRAKRSLSPPRRKKLSFHFFPMCKKEFVFFFKKICGISVCFVGPFLEIVALQKKMPARRSIFWLFLYSFSF